MMLGARVLRELPLGAAFDIEDADIALVAVDSFGCGPHEGQLAAVGRPGRVEIAVQTTSLATVCTMTGTGRRWS